MSPRRARRRPRGSSRRPERAADCHWQHDLQSPGGRLTHEDLVTAIPNVERYVRVESEQFANVASSQLTLAKHINEVFARDPALAGIVITSGTDTLEETAYFLNLTVRDERPVVVVGSMRNPSTLGYEGAANLLEGFRVAAEPASRSKGVLVVLNDAINAAREVTKTGALRLHTFQTRGYGVLGVVDADRVVYYRDGLKRHTARSKFDVSALSGLPGVDVMMVYQGAPATSSVQPSTVGAKGIVIASTGAGSTSGTQQEGIRYAADKGRSSSPAREPAAVAFRFGVPVGRRPVKRPTHDDAASCWGLKTWAPVKARVLLMLALATTHDPAEIQRMFSEY